VHGYRILITSHKYVNSKLIYFNHATCFENLSATLAKRKKNFQTVAICQLVAFHEQNVIVLLAKLNITTTNVAVEAVTTYTYSMFSVAFTSNEHHTSINV